MPRLVRLRSTTPNQMIHQLTTSSVRGLSVIMFVIALICCDANEIAAATGGAGHRYTYRVPSGSMEPTLKIGERVRVEVDGARLSEPHVGEIVMVHPPTGWAQQLCGPMPHIVALGGAACSEPEPDHSSLSFIKRITAGPGDVISIREGHVMRNGKREKDSYIRPCGGVPECNFPAAIRIPPGYWFMMGDNRGESDDSRFWGPVPTAWIVGTVIIDRKQKTGNAANN